MAGADQPCVDIEGGVAHSSGTEVHNLIGFELGLCKRPMNRPMTGSRRRRRRRRTTKRGRQEEEEEEERRRKRRRRRRGGGGGGRGGGGGGERRRRRMEGKESWGWGERSALELDGVADIQLADQ